MPVQKFRTFDEAAKALWNFSPTSHYYQTVHSLYRLASRFIAVSHSRGIYKFRTFDEAERHRFHCLVKGNLEASSPNGE
jgi:hypothetical protein